MMKRAIAILFVCILSLSLCACGGRAAESPAPEPSATPTPAPTPEPTPDLTEIAGAYKIREMASGEDGDLTDQIAALETIGGTITLELNRDGTGAITFYQEDAEAFTWDAQQLHVDGADIPFVYADDTVAMEMDGDKMVFARTTLEELRALEKLRAEYEASLEEDTEGLAGYYHPTAIVQGDEEIEPDESIYLYLDGDGSGYFHVNTSRYSLFWTLDGEDFSFLDEDGDTFEGSYRDGVIQGEYYDGYILTLEKGEPVEEDEEEATGSFTVPEESRPAVPGDYTLLGITSYEDGELDNTYHSLGIDITLSLYENGTGAIMMLGEYDDSLRWDDSHIYDPADPEEDWGTYLFDGETLILTEGDGVTIYRLNQEE